jgi:hypothetical protein
VAQVSNLCGLWSTGWQPLPLKMNAKGRPDGSPLLFWVAATLLLAVYNLLILQLKVF